MSSIPFPALAKKWILFSVLAVFGISLGFQPAFGQYFGRNKVQYEKFDYKVLKTEHFDIYFYPEEEAAVKVAGQMAERWYKRLSRLFSSELRGRQALIMYASHPQFEQTTVIPDVMSEGTGGVTESIKRRIILPFGGTLADTDHVIGHELVHAFQYDLAASLGSRLGQQGGSGLERAPLWFIEGMAEYLSIGPVDPLTAMWMRDMIKKKKLPTIKDLRDPYRYFPYRYGHSVWAYIGGKYGDIAVASILKGVIRGMDYDKALEKTCGVKLEKLSTDWQEALKKDYDPIFQATRLPETTGKLLIRGAEDNPYNVAPSLSPDGKKVVFISSRELFSIEMFMGDAKTGKVNKKLTKTAVDSHFQSIQFINSAGSWDMAGKRFVFGAVSEGKPVLAFLDDEGGKASDEIRFPTLGEILNPTWSPDGKRIAFSGLTGGYTDIYIYDLETKALRNMTQDPFGDIHPAWSPDGRWIAFVTERFTSQLSTLSIGDYQLALMNPETGEITPLKAFKEGKQINPQWSADSKSLFFIADRGGIPNVYRMDMSSGALFQVTNLYTGVSGITSLSPAISIAAKSNDVLYSVYGNGDFSIYSIEPQALLSGTPAPESAPFYSAAILPPRDRQGSEVLGLIKNSNYGLPDPSKFSVGPYKPKLTLDYVSQPQVGVGYDRFYGAYGGGGIALYWSDMLGWHNLMTMAQVSSRLMDSAAMVGYQNSKNRLNYGFVAQRIPYVYGDYAYGYQGDTYIEQEILYRQIYYELGGFASYPLSQMQRLEFSGGYDYIQFNNVIYTSYYDLYGNPLLIDDRTDLPSPPGLHMAYVSAALVYDSSLNGATAPILGQSYRLEISPTVGSLNYYSILADYRKYFMPVKPFTLAIRVMHYGRYGKGADDDRLYPMFLGYDWNIRGYDYNSFTAEEVDTANGGFDLNRLFGSRMMVANFELRFPLFGALGLGRGFYGIFPVDFFAFYDMGLAWDSQNKPWFVSGGDRKLIRSAGAGLRVNLFGYVVLGVNYVYPFDRPTKGWYWQFSFFPGF
jgi:Tol biopolymer transport system component